MIKDIFILVTLFSISYVAIPLATLNFINENNVNNYALFIICFTSFSAFAINMIYVYFKGKKVISPIISCLVALTTYFIFNKSILMVIALIIIFSFAGYLLGKLFTKVEDK